MRYLSVAVAAGMFLVSVSTSLHGQAAPTAVDPRSLALLAKGRAALAAGNLDAATDALETALVVDPANRGAYVALGEVAQRRELPGKAVRLYREALALDGNDVAALKGQGEALVARGAVQRAQANLTRIRQICGKSACPPAVALAGAIAKGPPVTTAAVVPTKVPPPAPTTKE